jgi:large subunit ribosomal protein L10e
MGNDMKEFQYTLELVSKVSVQVRDAAIESARMSSNRILENTLGKSNYKYKIMIFPHHVLRENPLAAGAGADRMSTGMAHAFGKIVGIAAQVKKGKIIAQLKVNKEHVEIARDALRRASSKLPCSAIVRVIENKMPSPAKAAPKKVA